MVFIPNVMGGSTVTVYGNRYQNIIFVWFYGNTEFGDNSIIAKLIRFGKNIYKGSVLLIYLE
jgi:hypothetical protein